MAMSGLSRLPHKSLWSLGRVTRTGFATAKPTTSVVPEVMVDTDAAKLAKTNDVIRKVKTEITEWSGNNRIFAIVSISNVQYRVAPNDLILVEGYEPFDIGDKITLDKVLLVGSKNFTLIGRPMLEKGTVRVEATVIEKTFSQTIPDFHYAPRKTLRVLNLYRNPLNILRINSVVLSPSHIAEAINDVNAKPKIS